MVPCRSNLLQDAEDTDERSPGPGCHRVRGGWTPAAPGTRASRPHSGTPRPRHAAPGAPRQSVKQSKDHAYRMLLPYRRPGRRWRHGADGTGTVTWTRTEAAPTDCPSTCSRATRRSCSSRPAAVHRGLPRRPLRGRPAGPVPDRGGEEMVWQDGRLTRAVREGAICILGRDRRDRKDTTVIPHLRGVRPGGKSAPAAHRAMFARFDVPPARPGIAETKRRLAEKSLPFRRGPHR